VRSRGWISPHGEPALRPYCCMKSILRRIRGAFGNAVVWGVAWFTGALAVYGGLSLFGVVGYGFGMVIEAAVNLGIIGAIAGVGFSGFIRWRYRAMSLTEIRPRAFALAGGLASGVLVPAFVVTGRFLTGAPALELGALAVSGLVAAVLGGGTAGASLLAAQSSAAELPAAIQARVPELAPAKDEKDEAGRGAA